jgi:pilus assembly protein Flp/PilA
MKRIVKSVLKCERAATTIEYGMILALIVLAMMAALNGFANGSNAMWNDISTKMSEASA